MKTSYYNKALLAQNEQDAALQWARNKLLAKGYSYPAKTLDKPLAELYDAMRQYGEMEAAFVREYFKIKQAEQEPKLPKMKERKLVPAKPIAMPYYDD